MHAQLTRPADAAEQRNNVTVRVLELHSGPQQAAHEGSFTVFTFADHRQPDVAHPDGVDKYFDDPSRVERYVKSFEALEDAALDAEESIALILVEPRDYEVTGRATADQHYSPPNEDVPLARLPLHQEQLFPRRVR